MRGTDELDETNPIESIEIDIIVVINTFNSLEEHIVNNVELWRDP